MSEPAVRLEKVGKQYQLGITNADSLSELAAKWTRGLWQGFAKHLSGTAPRAGKQAFWAVRDISFDVQPGEVFGIVGRNGAGKSTLLKLISRVTSPTTGQIQLLGRVSSLLEVGTGFHPDLTGRENIYMNATLLGMTRHEVRQRIDDIVEFAGIGDFLETPVKRYSSGMRVRLGFAVAAHLEPEILIVDEVLTVGDAEFQAKCLGKMKSVTTEGRTVLFVSHNMGAVRGLCSRACLLDRGRLVTIGSADDVVDQYLSAMGNEAGRVKRYPADETFDLDGQPMLRPISFVAQASSGGEQAAFTTDHSIELRFEFQALSDLSNARIGVLVRNLDNVTLFGSNCTLVPVSDASQPVIVSCLIPGSLLNRGTYVVDLGLDRPPQNQQGVLDQECIQFEVVDIQGHGTAAETLPGVVRPKLRWTQT